MKSVSVVKSKAVKSEVKSKRSEVVKSKRSDEDDSE
jgi:hypothetical protein